MANRPPIDLSVRKLDPSDPRSPEHPSHDEQFRELARAVGRALARRDWERAHNGKIERTSSDEGSRGKEEGRALRKVLKRSAKGSVDR
jgi:hypothetical protein